MLFSDCILRPMNDSDLYRVHRWRNSERVRRHMFSDEVITIQDHEVWWRRIAKSDTDLYFIFEFQGEAAGLVSFNGIHSVHKRCTWGFYLGDEELPRGTGSAMGYLALDYLFTKTSIQKVIGEVLKTNAASLAFHRKLGFTVEGEFRNHIARNNSFVNVVVLSLLGNEWAAERDQLYHVIFE